MKPAFASMTILQATNAWNDFHLAPYCNVQKIEKFHFDSRTSNLSVTIWK